MSTTKTLQKPVPPQIVKLDKALKLAEQWVNNMAKSTEDEPTEVETEGRPSRLGLGAKVSRKTKFVPSNNPVERKLFAKLDAEKRKSAKISKESVQSAGDGCDDDDEDDNDLESRTSVFVKKRPIPPTSYPHATKKQK